METYNFYKYVLQKSKQWCTITKENNTKEIKNCSSCLYNWYVECYKKAVFDVIEKEVKEKQKNELRKMLNDYNKEQYIERYIK